MAPATRARWALALALFSSFTPSTAQAQEAGAPPRVRLEYQRGADAQTCPEEPELRRSVIERLGYDPFVDQARRVVEVRIERTAAGLASFIRLRDQDGVVLGQREIASAGTDCVELASSTALAMAIAVDPLVLTRPEPPPSSAVAPQQETPPVRAGSTASSRPDASADPQTSATTSAERAPDADWTTYPFGTAPPPPPPISAPAARSNTAPVGASPSTPVVSRQMAPAPDARSDADRPPNRFLVLGATGLGAVGTSPALTAGAIVHAGLRWDGTYLGLEGRGDLPGEMSLGRARVSAGQLAGGLVACGHGSWFGGCGVVNVGVLRSEAKNVLNPTPSTPLWVTIGTRGLLDVPVADSLRWRFQIDVAAQLTRTRLTIGAEDAWISPPVSLSVGSGLVLRLPL